MKQQREYTVNVDAIALRATENVIFGETERANTDQTWKESANRQRQRTALSMWNGEREKKRERHYANVNCELPMHHLDGLTKAAPDEREREREREREKWTEPDDKLEKAKTI